MDDGKRAGAKRKPIEVALQAARPLGRGPGRGVSAKIGRGKMDSSALADLYL